MDYSKYQKLESLFATLAKDDMTLQDALKIARKAHPEAGKTLASHIYKDSMVPKVGNKFAYEDFLKRHANSGIHLSLDANGFGAINKEHGFETGNKAIKQMGNSISEVARKFGLKTFRVGGDEFRLHASTPERAQGFLTELKQRLAQDPKVAHNHQVSVSVGVGYNPEHAEKALIGAKDQLGPLVSGKRQKIHPLGSEPTVHHSLLHEPPPANWKPEKDHPNMGKPAAAPIPGLSMKNPLQ